MINCLNFFNASKKKYKQKNIQKNIFNRNSNRTPKNMTLINTEQFVNEYESMVECVHIWVETH